MFLAEVAKKHPDQYPKIAKQLGDLGRKLTYSRGETFRLNDFKPLIDRKPIFKALDDEIAQAGNMTLEEFESAFGGVTGN